MSWPRILLHYITMLNGLACSGVFEWLDAKYVLDAKTHVVNNVYDWFKTNATELLVKPTKV